MKRDISLILLISAAAFLPGCDWLKNRVEGSNTAATTTNEMTGTVLASANGKPVMTVESFEKEFNNFIEKHPAGAMLASMEGIERKIFDGLVSQRLISHYIREKGLDQSAEYQDQLQQLKYMLDARYFEMQNQPQVSDSELQAYYNERKEVMPELVLSRGGVNTLGVQFDKEADAKAFLEKAKGKGAQLMQIAKDAGIAADRIRDFKLINAKSIGIDPMLVEKVVSFKKFPTLEVVKAGDVHFWVVYASAKEEQKFRPFDQVKQVLKERLTMEKQRDNFDKAVEKLKKDYSLTVDESYFTKKEEAKKAQDQVDEQLEMVMPAEKEAAAKPDMPAKMA